MTELEIERTFLAAHIPAEIKGVKPQILEDTYLTRGSGKSIIRIRKAGNYYELTKKISIGNDHSTHDEQTIILTEEEYEVLRDVSELQIKKRRYTVNIEGDKAEVDVFDCKLTGLVLIDFEFSSEQERDAFKPPRCCLADVTQDKEISAGELVGKSYKDIGPWLQSKGYTKLV